jgi:hypothetical protein
MSKHTVLARSQGLTVIAHDTGSFHLWDDQLGPVDFRLSIAELDAPADLRLTALTNHTDRLRRTTYPAKGGA